MFDRNIDAVGLNDNIVAYRTNLHLAILIKLNGPVSSYLNNGASDPPLALNDRHERLVLSVRVQFDLRVTRFVGPV